MLFNPCNPCCTLCIAPCCHLGKDAPSGLPFPDPLPRGLHFVGEEHLFYGFPPNEVTYTKHCEGDAAWYPGWAAWIGESTTTSISDIIVPSGVTFDESQINKRPCCMFISCGGGGGLFDDNCNPLSGSGYPVELIPCSGTPNGFSASLEEDDPKSLSLVVNSSKCKPSLDLIYSGPWHVIPGGGGAPGSWCALFDGAPIIYVNFYGDPKLGLPSSEFATDSFSTCGTCPCWQKCNCLDDVTIQLHRNLDIHPADQGLKCIIAHGNTPNVWPPKFKGWHGTGSICGKNLEMIIGDPICPHSIGQFGPLFIWSLDGEPGGSIINVDTLNCDSECKYITTIGLDNSTLCGSGCFGVSFAHVFSNSTVDNFKGRCVEPPCHRTSMPNTLHAVFENNDNWCDYSDPRCINAQCVEASGQVVDLNWDRRAGCYRGITYFTKNCEQAWFENIAAGICDCVPSGTSYCGSPDIDFACQRPTGWAGHKCAVGVAVTPANNPTDWTLTLIEMIQCQDLQYDCEEACADIECCVLPNGMQYSPGFNHRPDGIATCDPVMLQFGFSCILGNPSGDCSLTSSCCNWYFGGAFFSGNRSSPMKVTVYE